MREPLEVIAEIKGFISSQNPLRFPYQEETIVNLLNELENSLTPQPFEEPIVEEPIIGEILEVTFSEPVLIEETVVEEPIVEKAAKKTPAKKTTTK